MDLLEHFPHLCILAQLQILLMNLLLGLELPDSHILQLDLAGQQ